MARQVWECKAAADEVARDAADLRRVPPAERQRRHDDLDCHRHAIQCIADVDVAPAEAYPAGGHGSGAANSSSARLALCGGSVSRLWARRRTLAGCTRRCTICGPCAPSASCGAGRPGTREAACRRCGASAGAGRRMVTQRARRPVPRCYIGDVAEAAPMEARAAVVAWLSAWRRAALRRGPMAQALGAAGLTHWAAEAVALCRALCVRGGAQGGSSSPASRWWRCF